MVATPMASSKSGSGSGKKSGLKVRQEDAQLVGLVATHRGLTIEKFFMEDDVQSFFKGLLRVEMKKKEKQLGEEGKK
jgi:hypothetical protein